MIPESLQALTRSARPVTDGQWPSSKILQDSSRTSLDAGHIVEGRVNDLVPIFRFDRWIYLFLI